MEIVMIGPVYPYRGGIAHYTSLMVRELSKKHSVTTISYKLQYPKILYPRSTQKDYENTSFQIDDTNFLINTINPISYHKTVKFIKNIKPDLVIVQWWHPFFAPAYRHILRRVKKFSKVIFLCHNVLPHEKFPLQRTLTQSVLNNGDAFIVQSKPDEETLYELIPNAKCTRTVHPTYNAFNLTGIEKHSARAKVGLSDDSEVLLFFGFVREYKGLKHLLNAMPEISKALPKCKLLIVGDILDSEKKDYLARIEQTKCKDNIILISDYVPDSEVENYFSACDLVVLPYESATQSGIVQISYGFEKPVIATDVGGLPEVVSDGKTGFVVPPCSAKVLSDAVIRFFKEDKANEFHQHIKGEIYKYSWERMTEIVEELCNWTN